MQHYEYGEKKSKYLKEYAILLYFLAYYNQVDEIFNNYPRLKEYNTDKKSQQLCFGIFTAQALLKYLQRILCLPANIISTA